MPVSIILRYSENAKRRAMAKGFVPLTVLVRYESVMSADTQARERITSEVLQDIRPHQYSLTDFWGMGADNDGD